VKRFAQILRSVLPEHFTQLVFLFGVVCLFIAPQLRWGARFTINVPSLFNPLTLVILAPYLIQFAGSVGYFLCFRPSSHPVRRLAWWVCLPAVMGLTVQCSCYIYVSGHGNGDTSPHTIGSSLASLSNLGPGFHYASIGFVLVAVFTLCVAFGGAYLPLALPESSVVATEDVLSWNRWHIPIWFLLAGAAWCALILFWLIFKTSSAPSLLHHVWLISALIYAVSFTVFVGAAVWMTGKGALESLRRSVRLPLPESFLLAMVLSTTAVFLGSLSRYFFERARLGLNAFGNSARAPFASYFAFPAIGLFCSTILFAFFEEAIFRGVLQPRFVRRYGLLRGIFLVGIVWAAWHFAGDFSPRFSDGAVAIALGLRLARCVAMSSVLGWLTLRTHSILPAILAHAIYNSFVESPAIRWTTAQDGSTILSWALLGFVLLRWWPVEVELIPESGAHIANPAPQP
jgi:membrane protease YdiL (CAAX protease family)